MRPFRKFLLFLGMMSFTGAYGQLKKEADFLSTAHAVIKAFTAKDLKTLNSMIHPVYGMYLLFRPGAMDRYQKFTKLDNDSFYTLQNISLYPADLVKFTLKYGRLPRYDCDKSRWNKKGYFADTVRHFSPITEIADFEMQYERIMLSKQKRARIRTVEQGSRKIIFTGSKGEGIIFYLFYSDEKWYLSIIDTVTTDCSA